LAAGVSQQLVADELRVDRATVTRYELGERTPRGELLISYIRLLDELREAIEPRDTSSPLGASSTQEVGRGRVQSP
jgi:transcriptional regulator with XRE-family HTH domain